MGTAGQRCTTCRRLYLQESIYDKFLERLVAAYKQVKIGDPLEKGVLCGPVHSQQGVKIYREGIEKIKAEHGKILVGGNVSFTVVAS